MRYQYLRFAILFLVTQLGLCFAEETSNVYENTISIIRQFYEHKRVSLVTAFICWGAYEHSLVQHLGLSDIQVNFPRQADALVNILENDVYFKIGVILDLACENSQDALQKASLKKQFDIHKFWILLENGSLSSHDQVYYKNKSNEVIYSIDNNIFPEGVLSHKEIFDISYELSEFAIEALSGLRILEDSEVTWIPAQYMAYNPEQHERYNSDISKEASKVIPLLDIYKTSIVQPLNVSTMGIAYIYEDAQVAVTFAKRATNTQRRFNLHGAHFKTATVILYPEEFTTWEDMSLRHVDKWSKIHWPIYGYLSEQMNFTFEVSFQLDNYGWLINGSFDGMMGYMQREEVEFPSTGIFVRKDRFAVTSYAADTFPLRATTIFRQPSLSTVSNIFTLPFDSSVWLSCLALCFTAIATLELQIKLTVKEHVEKDMVYSKLSDIFTFVLGAICQQGFHITPSSLAGRTTVFILTLSSLFLFTSYSANIVALLQTPSTSFKTISDLTHSPMILAVENQTYNRVYMQETTDPELREFYLHKIVPMGEKVYCHASIGMEQIKKRMHAFQVDTTSAYKIMSETYEEYEKCGLKEIDLFPAPMFTIAVTKGSPLRDYFSQRVRWYREVGLLDRLFQIWMPQKAKCESNAGGFVSVSLVEFYPAMLVLQYGTLVAVGILIIERLYFHRSCILSKMILNYPQQSLEKTTLPTLNDKIGTTVKQSLKKRKQHK